MTEEINTDTLQEKIMTFRTLRDIPPQLFIKTINKIGDPNMMLGYSGDPFATMNRFFFKRSGLGGEATGYLQPTICNLNANSEEMVKVFFENIDNYRTPFFVNERYMLTTMELLSTLLIDENRRETIFKELILRHNNPDLVPFIQALANDRDLVEPLFKSLDTMIAEGLPKEATEAAKNVYGILCAEASTRPLVETHFTTPTLNPNVKKSIEEKLSTVEVVSSHPLLDKLKMHTVEKTRDKVINSFLPLRDIFTKLIPVYRDQLRDRQQQIPQQLKVASADDFLFDPTPHRKTPVAMFTSTEDTNTQTKQTVTGKTPVMHRKTTRVLRRKHTPVQDILKDGAKSPKDRSRSPSPHNHDTLPDHM